MIGKALKELNKVAYELDGSWGKDFQTWLIRFKLFSINTCIGSQFKKVKNKFLLSHFPV